MGITLVIFRDFGNILFPKDRFIKFARGTLTVLSSTFKSFAGILLGPVVFRYSMSLLKTALHWC